MTVKINSLMVWIIFPRQDAIRDPAQYAGTASCKNIGNTDAFSVLIPGALQLVCRNCTTPQKINR